MAKPANAATAATEEDLTHIFSAEKNGISQLSLEQLEQLINEKTDKLSLEEQARDYIAGQLRGIALALTDRSCFEISPSDAVLVDSASRIRRIPTLQLSMVLCK